MHQGAIDPPLLSVNAINFALSSSTIFIFASIALYFLEQESVAAEIPAQVPVPSCLSHKSHETVIARAERMLTQLRSGPLAFPSNQRQRKHLGRRSKIYQRNLVVIDYPGAHAPTVHTLHDYDKVYEGVLRFDINMSERDVREEICRLAKGTKILFMICQKSLLKISCLLK